SIEAAYGRGSDYAFGSATRSHHCVYSGPEHGSCNARRKVTIGDESDARARLAHVGNELLVTRAIKDDDHQVFYSAIQHLRDHRKVVGDRRLEVDHATAGRADHH